MCIPRSSFHVAESGPLSVAAERVEEQTLQTSTTGSGSDDRMTVRAKCGKAYRMSVAGAERFAHRILESINRGLGDSLKKCLKDASVTFTTGDGKPYIKIQFQSLEEAQAFHRELIERNK